AIGLVRRNVAKGTANLFMGPAMSASQTTEALSVGSDMAREAITNGSRLLVTGDMGIGNTTPSAALIARFTGSRASDVTGRGTGVDDEMLAVKIRVIETGLARLSPDASTP